MEFEFDSLKSDSNARKHGIDFVEAQRIWHDPEFIEIPARTISVRRSREEEIAIYEGHES
ncbi:MAG: BrnT family toxin [Spirochaetes bacterium]|nr:BrnT family toxin [Spirochaetota bacterium]